MIFDGDKLLDTFVSLPAIIETYFKNIPAAALDRKRSADAWTIREHLYHIAGVQKMLYGRLKTIRDEDDPVIKPYFPDEETENSPFFDSIEKALEHYKACRNEQLLLIRQLTGSDYEKEAVHKEYTNYSIPILINHMIFHEYWHMYRIEELWLTRDEFFT